MTASYVIHIPSKEIPRHNSEHKFLILVKKLINFPFTMSSLKVNGIESVFTLVTNYFHAHIAWSVCGGDTKKSTQYSDRIPKHDVRHCQPRWKPLALLHLYSQTCLRPRDSLQSFEHTMISILIIQHTVCMRMLL